MKKIRVLIVDEHPAVCQALGVRLNSYTQVEVLAVASNVSEGLAYVCSLGPDVVLLGPKGGIAMPRHQRLSAIIALTRQFVHGSAGIILLAPFADEVEREATLRAGARRYLLKNIDSDHLVAEIEAVAAEVAAERGERPGARNQGTVVGDSQAPTGNCHSPGLP